MKIIYNLIVTETAKSSDFSRRLGFFFFFLFSQDNLRERERES